MSDQARSLYIHIPFCRHRCGYCNFALLAGRDELIDRYLAALATEFSWLTNVPEVATIFVGGGTPSRLSVSQIQLLFELVEKTFKVHPDSEITVECNPDDISDKFCKTLKGVGASRISLGVQSFDDDKLKFLEREHSRMQIENAIEVVGEHFDNFSIDLIFAAQGERLDTWLSDLRSAISMQPQHISTYELTIEKGTRFWNSQHRGSLVVPGEELRAELYEATIETMLAAGFEHYEISSFAQSGFRCRHNLAYWDGSEYLAFGASAARYVNSVRETNHRSPTTYMKRVRAGETPVFESELISPDTQMLEKIAFGLRQLDGVCLPDDISGDLKKLLMRLNSHRLIIESDKHLKLTRHGLMVYDSIAQEILSI